MSELISLDQYGITVESRSVATGDNQTIEIFVSALESGCTLSNMGIKTGFTLRTIGSIEIRGLGDVQTALTYLSGNSATQYVVFQFSDETGSGIIKNLPDPYFNGHQNGSSHIANPTISGRTLTPVTRSGRRITRLDISDVIRGAEKLGTFFVAAATTIIVIGFFSSIGIAYNATHVSQGGVTQAIDNAGWYFIEIFFFAFGGVCIAAALLAFFAYTLRLLIVQASRD